MGQRTSDQRMGEQEEDRKSREEEEEEEDGDGDGDGDEDRQLIREQDRDSNRPASTHDTGPRSLIYDQNRNLNLEEISEEDKMVAVLVDAPPETGANREDEDEAAGDDDKVEGSAKIGTHQNSSSCSLTAASDCTTGSVDITSTSLVQQVSARNSINGQQALLSTNQLIRSQTKSNGGYQQMGVLFASNEYDNECLAGKGKLVKRKSNDDDSIRINMLEMQDDEGEQEAASGADTNGQCVAGGDRRDKTGGDRKVHEPMSLVSQLGRRVSLLPQLLARRMSANKHQGAGQRAYTNARRYSLQNQASFPADSSGMGAPEHQASTVAGVGGTITTVTRSKRKTAPLPRLVAKNGTVNLFLDNIDRRQYVRDLFTTMIDIKWRYNLMAAAFGFVFSWLFFACVWYAVLYVHNDLEHENDPSWSPCIVNVYSFPAALLFSIETQSTLGFGSRIISVECPGAIVIFCVQLIFGVVVECLIVGMVFAKLSRPAKRSQTIMYSKYATVCLRETQMCLMFRVGDVRSKSHIIGATIRASLVSQKTTAEGETIPFYHRQLEVKIDDAKNSLLLIWPLTIVHLIDESSPFYRLGAEQLANFKFEIITVLEGTVESTGQAIQVRSSYLPSEVKWGYRFEPIVSTHGYGRYAQTIIDYNKFNRVVKVDMPSCSPMEYYAQREAQLKQAAGGQEQPAANRRPLAAPTSGAS